MSKKEKGLVRFKKRVKQLLREGEQKCKIEEIERKQKESAGLEARKIYDQWFEKYKAPAKQAAQVVFSWYQGFIASAEFNEFAEAEIKLKKTSRNIWITGIIKCSVPNSWGGNWIQCQSLTIDVKGKLFVHNHEKYGKSYPIANPQYLFDCVYPPILIAVAKTVTDETIWDIVKIT